MYVGTFHPGPTKASWVYTAESVRPRLAGDGRQVRKVLAWPGRTLKMPISWDYTPHTFTAARTFFRPRCLDISVLYVNVMYLYSLLKVQQEAEKATTEKDDTWSKLGDTISQFFSTEDGKDGAETKDKDGKKEDKKKEDKKKDKKKDEKEKKKEKEAEEKKKEALKPKLETVREELKMEEQR